MPSHPKMQSIIDVLVDDLSPRRPLRMVHGFAAMGGATVLAMIALVLALGLRADIMSGSVSPMFFLRQGALLLLGLATGITAVRMARPAVGQESSGWKWALGGALLFPATAIVMALRSPDGLAVLQFNAGMDCLIFGSLSAMLVSGVITMWLQRGAPTALERAGWLTGIAGGSLGAFAYGIHCPVNNIYYIGLWYTLVVASCAVVGRLLVPRLIRW